MNRESLWIVVGITAVWVSFLLGYAVSSHTTGTPTDGPKAAAGGYGKLLKKPAATPAVGEEKKAAN